MKNRLLSVLHDSIPYVKEFRPVAGSVTACIVMQQLDYWFDRYPDGFYKFMEPCEHKDYRPEDSWTEQLGMSVDEFRSAFDKIGTRHVSKTAYMAAEDKFKGKFYCSYYDKKDGRTWYYRDHERTDAAIDEIIRRKSEHPSPRDGNSNLSKRENPSLQIETSNLQKLESPRSLVSTENTSESSTENTSSDDESKLTPDEIEALADSLSNLRMPINEARRHAKQSPELVRECLEIFAVVDKSKLISLLASVRSFFKDPTTWREQARRDNHTNGHNKPRIDTAKLDAAIAREETRLYESLPPKLRAEIDREVDRGESFSAVMERRFMIRASVMQWDEVKVK